MESIQEYLKSKGFEIQNDSFIKYNFGVDPVRIPFRELEKESIDSFKEKAKRKGWRIEADDNVDYYFPTIWSAF